MRKRFGGPRLGVVGLLLLAAASAAMADVVTLAPDRDNTLFEDATGSLSDGAGPVVFAGNNGQDLARRALLRFDVAGNVPYGARIDAVQLRLNCSNATNSTLRTFTLHRVLEDWGEGASSTTSGSGAPAAAGDATWLHTFYSAAAWTTPGGDYVAAASASQSVGDVGTYTWADAGIRADVQDWLNGTNSNFGWLLLGEELALNTARRFDSRENAVVANRPELTIQYSFNTADVSAEDGRRASLEVAHPNPFRGTCRIGFTLASDAEAQVVVDDVAGRRVATLAQGRYGPGRWETRWEGFGVSGQASAPGIYFLRLIVKGRLVGTRTIVRLR